MRKAKGMRVLWLAILCLAAWALGAARAEDAGITLPGTAALDAPIAWQDGTAGALMAEEGDALTWRFTVPREGDYTLCAEYYALPGTGGSIELELMLDGAYPFQTASQLTLTRLFRDEEPFPWQDAQGNDQRWPQVEISQWQSRRFFDVNGFTAGALTFHLTAGEHELTLISIRESLMIGALRFEPVEALPTYEAYLAGYGEAAPTAGECVILEAEQTLTKTSTMLYPISDRADALTYPSDPILKRLNTIGGENWSHPDQTITWAFEVPSDGWYALAFRYRQNTLRGMEVYRELAVDGRTLFDGMDRMGFPYGVGWQTATLESGGETAWLYLTAGEHTLSMTPTVAQLAPLMQAVNEAVGRLNTLYRRIIMITGSTPDLYRDYYLYESIPGLIDALVEEAQTLRAVVRDVEALTGRSGTEAASLERLAEQLESFAEYPDTIPSRLSTFRDNIVTISAWVLEVKEQALQLDRIFILPKGAALPQTEATLAQSVRYHLAAFVGSFTYDYEAIGGVEEGNEVISVWISSGRDQAEVLKELIDSMFTPESGVSVELSIAQTGLMQAVMAGKGPDVAIMLGHGDAVNYAIRGAVLPLDGLEGFEELTAQYMPGSMLPYEYNGHYYGLPNSQNFLMMFYRTDVFEELGLTPPETWDDLRQVAETLQRNNMNIGLPYVSLDAYQSVSTGIGGASLFPTLLLQRGMDLYTQDGRTTLDQSGALAAFKTWTDYYTQYGFPLYKDDFNRFRTGEMPLVITNYTFYNQLDTAAPEISNQWAMALIPGTRQEDGTLNRTTAASGTVGMILSTTEKADAAWAFMRWWNSAETQAAYGRQIENVLGSAGRYNPANVEAMRLLPWSGRERALIMEQWAWVRELRELPGSYYVSRNIDNAFKAVYYDHENYREALNYWNRQINDELERKRLEFSAE